MKLRIRQLTPVILLVVPAVGCAQIIGADWDVGEGVVAAEMSANAMDDDPPVMPDDDDVSPQGGNSNLPPGECTPGSTRCAGEKIERCTPQAIWAETTDCAEGSEVCSEEGEVAMCVPGPPCLGGIWRCFDNRLQECNEEGAWAPRESCATAGHCSTKLRKCSGTVCDDGAIQCSANQLVRCTAGVWQVEQVCAETELCDDTLGECRPCSIGAGSCFGAALYRCSEVEQQWVLEAECASFAECSVDGCGAADAGAP